jgi:hypothetical protein
MIDLVPAWATVGSTAAAPVPEQLGVVMLHRPEGTAVAWFSKPSQNTTVPEHGPAVGVADGVGDALPVGVAEALGEGVGAGGLHATPLTAKLAGVSLEPE